MLTVSGPLLSLSRSALVPRMKIVADDERARMIREKATFQYAHSRARTHDHVGVRYLHLRHARQSKSDLYSVRFERLRLQVVLSRNYRGDIEMNVIENFLQLLLEREEESRLAPIFQTADVSFVYIKHSDIYRNRSRVSCHQRSFCLCDLVTCTTKINANVAMVLSFLYRCVRVFSEYFHDFQEESVRDNFVIVYELLDELMDFGFPQSTDSKILQEYITQNSHKLEEVRPPSALTNRVSWRSDGIKYSKNEVFLDVVEQLNLLVHVDPC